MSEFIRDSPRALRFSRGSYSRIARSFPSKSLLSTNRQTTNMRFLSSPSWKRWDKPMIESNGDYRDEAYIEDLVGGPLYQYQKTLPRLPVPTLKDTIERFLPTALPLAKTDEERVALERDANNFLSEAKPLQERLLARQEEMKDSSWLQLWWNQMGYLCVRDSVVINVSYFFHFMDDPSVQYGSQTNIQRAASLLHSTAEFRKLVVTGQMEPERVGKNKTPLCSTAYKYMFNACRIPKLVMDSYRLYDPSLYTHAIVSRKGHFFSIELVDNTGEALPIQVLESQLQECIQLADSIEARRPRLGILTASNRDEWGRWRSTLLEKGGDKMKQALEVLESGAVLLCLDDESPVSKLECGNILLTGGSHSGHNRWFDKSIQLIVTENGKAGFLGEHSMMDGMPCVKYADFITKSTYEDRKHLSKSSPSPGTVVDIFKTAFEDWELSLEVQKMEDQATFSFNDTLARQSMDVQSFQGYGSRFIKKAGFSPDAYVQAAMQLATYRLFGELAGTYEATQVRPFLHGRTETTRTVSPAMAKFVKTMGMRPARDEFDDAERSKKLSQLKDATVSHTAYIGKAAAAQGVDRHFLGLSLLSQDHEELPALYSNKTFQYAKRWRVSTSNLSHPKFLNWGYGQVVSDGVGLSYAILPESCQFNVTALLEHGWTDKLSFLLEEALLEMQALVEADQTPRSKL